MENLKKISIRKLLEAGYIFLRADDFGGPMGNEPKIKESRHFGSWCTLSRHGTKKERDAAMRELVERAGSKYIVID